MTTTDSYPTTRTGLGLRWIGPLILLVVGIGGYVGYRQFNRPAPAAIPEIVVPADDPQLSAAIKKAVDDVRADPRNGKAWGQLGMLLAVHRYSEHAAVCFHEAVRQAPKESRWHYHLGLVALSFEPVEAAAHFQRAYDLKKSEHCQYRLAATLLSLGRDEEADPHFTALVAAEPEHRQPYLGKARIHLNRGELGEAEPLLAAVQSDPGCRRQAIGMLSEIRARQGKADEARKLARHASELLPDTEYPDPENLARTELMTGIARRHKQVEAYIERRRFAEAEQTLRSLTADRPGSHRFQLELGYVLMEQRKFPEAEAALASLVTGQHDAPIAAYYLGIVRFNRGNHVGAIEAFQTAVRLKPDYGSAYSRLAMAREKNGDRGGAVEAIQQAISCRPESADYRLDYAELALRMNDLPEANRQLQMAAELNPEHPRLGKVAEAVRKSAG